MLSSAVLFFVGLSFTTPLLKAQATDYSDIRSLKEDLNRLKQTQEQMQKELQDIKSLLKTRRGPQVADVSDVTMSLEGIPLKGLRSAKVVVVEFSDYQCPYCARYFRETYGRLEEEYIRTGKILYALRDFPLESIHPRAWKAAEAARCSGEQGQYWEMHDRLFSNRGSMADKDLADLAQALKLDLPVFETCLQSNRQAAVIRKDLEDGRRFGISGTPTFFIGVIEPTTGQMRSRKTLRGAASFESFKQALDTLLGLQEADSEDMTGVK